MMNQVRDVMSAVAGVGAGAVVGARTLWVAVLVAVVFAAGVGLPRAAYAHDDARAHGAEDCSTATAEFAQMEVARISLLDANGQRVSVRARIADERAERAAGYQYICPSVIERSTILFRYDAPVVGQFHMRNVQAPLDIGFFDARGLLFQYQVMQPYPPGESYEDERLYGPLQEFQYALEAREGFYKEMKLAAGRTRLVVESLPPAR